MSTQVIMPQLGESVVEGTVGKWLIAEGQPVVADEPLLQIITDKVEAEIPAPASGILLEICVPEGETVATGTTLAIIQDVRPDAAVPPVAAPPVVGSQVVGRSFLSPAVSRLAAELQVDLSQVTGTGEGGRITRKDVQAFAAARPAGQPGAPMPGRPHVEAPAVSAEPQTVERPALSPPALSESEIVPLTPLRRSIAAHMVLSAQTAAQATTVMEADMTAVVLARERLRAEFSRQGVRLTFTPFFVQAIVAGLRAVPEANSAFRDDALVIHKRVHVGVAVAVPDGLIVPVIRDADEKNLLGLARAVSDLADRSRNGRLTPDEVQGGTFTLTNHGVGGSLFATPIIVQPQAGILGVGAIHKRPVVLSRGDALLPDAADAIAIRPMIYLSFTFDHRVLDGQGADRFLAVVKRFIEDYQG
jgi:2-oxoglutarate dehydrogenase E2 component (dihydrolipoamide succinyltransferase)